jgi:3-deoxy-D-manno-octulosonic-acid transferase
MILYNISIVGYYLLILFSSLFNKKAKSFITGRKNNWKKIKNIKKSTNYWFHCASLGEFDQGLPLMKMIKEQDSSIQIIVTFFSPSGMENYHKRDHVADHVFYLPIDTPYNAKKFIKLINPTKIFFVKYEFWLNYIFTAKKQNIPLYSISCILRKNQHFFKPHGFYFRKGLKCFNHFFVQNIETLELLKSININNATLTGDTRYDKVIENRDSLKKDDIISHFLRDDKAIILGSSWPIEEKIFSECLTTYKYLDKIIIAPHDISEKHLCQIEQLFPKKIIRYSNFENYSNQQILLIDSIGKLSNAYQYGKIAIIGGGFTGKLHNILEPVVFGLPILFGPKFSKFPEASIFIETKIAQTFENTSDLNKSINSMFSKRNSIKELCNENIAISSGATRKIFTAIFDLNIFN